MKQNVNLKTTEQMQMHAYVQMPEWAADKKQKKIKLAYTLKKHHLFALIVIYSHLVKPKKKNLLTF